jgi:hypothetical protein
MNDYEVKIFNNVHPVAAPLCAKNKFLSTPVVDLTALPASGLWEMDNSTVRDRQTSTPAENYSLITYQLEVYAKTKSECRTMYKAIDERMLSMNFSRISGQYVTYPDNMHVVRYVARYEAVVDRDGNLYRRG